MALTLRLATEADAAGCLAIYRPFVERTAVSFETDVPSVEAFAGRIAAVLQRAPWLVAADPDGPSSSIAGYAYATRFRERAAYQWVVESTVYVAESHRGRGVGRLLYANLLACLRLQGFTAVYGVITLPNPASVALHEALGFTPAGVWPAVGHKLGAWHDVGLWHLRLQAPAPEPRPPTPLPELAAELRFPLR
ncbi:MAG: N-acetyltransferase [Candidatus Lambdaproteobacteria bacterium]|nr:N-acetyltransferase [Candidatus Lambdaproteobacteria bacterium]